MFKVLLLSTFFIWQSQQISSPDISYQKHCISGEELKLFNLLNEYRKDKKLPAVPLSKSLSFVARQHVIDLYENVKTLSHEWSTCKYDASNKKTFPCMWLKPSELTNYKSYGYECAFSLSSGNVMAEDALKGWKGSQPHNNVILNKGMWSKMKWNALGVGIYKNYAVIWFGENEDEEGKPEVCG